MLTKNNARFPMQFVANPPKHGENKTLRLLHPGFRPGSRPIIQNCTSANAGRTCFLNAAHTIRLNSVMRVSYRSAYLLFDYYTSPQPILYYAILYCTIHHILDRIGQTTSSFYKLTYDAQRRRTLNIMRFRY